MEAISFIITNFNTKKYTEFVYNSIRKNLGYVHEIVMLDDGSEDGTWEILEELKSKDHNMIIHRNENNIGIAYSYNKMVELSSNEIVCMLHSDMYVPPKFDEIMLKYMEDYDFITPLRVEPDVGYPPSIDKELVDFGIKSENFDEGAFLKWSEKNTESNRGRTEQRMFFPWMTTKTLYNKVGGNDLLFLKYMVDDDDFYLRIKMSGAKYCQLFETAVYHMPSKSHKGGDDNKFQQSEFDNQYLKSIRNFIRKWGVWPGKTWDNNRDMIIPKKYDIGLVAQNCDRIEVLHFLEPWCSTIYISDLKVILNYSISEQEQTKFDLSNRVKSMQTKEKNNDVIVEFDSTKLNNERAEFIQNLPYILDQSGEPGTEMEYDIFRVIIKEKKNIVNDNIQKQENINV